MAKQPEFKVHWLSDEQVKTVNDALKVPNPHIEQLTEIIKVLDHKLETVYKELPPVSVEIHPTQSRQSDAVRKSNPILEHDEWLLCLEAYQLGVSADVLERIITSTKGSDRRARLQKEIVKATA
jgi:hypothetical protein